MSQVGTGTKKWKMVDIQLQWTKAGLVLSDFRVCKVVLSSCETLHEREWQIDLGHLLIVAQTVTDWSKVKRIHRIRKQQTLHFGVLGFYAILR